MITATPIPILSDNYAWLLRCTATGACAVVDPSDADVVLAALRALDARPSMILNTHHHLDHVAGNEALAAAFPGIAVIAHVSDRGRVPAQTASVENFDKVSLGDVTLQAMHVPGHSLGDVAWAAPDAAFTGDTLFLAGCGRIFEGHPQMMLTSLDRLATELDPRTRIYCGHEYTVKNLRFALTVEPGSADLVEALRFAESQRAAGTPTVPHTLANELRTNPFLRCDDDAFADAIGVRGGPLAVFTHLRELRNAF